MSEPLMPRRMAALAKKGSVEAVSESGTGTHFACHVVSGRGCRCEMRCQSLSFETRPGPLFRVLVRRAWEGDEGVGEAQVETRNVRREAPELVQGKWPHTRRGTTGGNPCVEDTS